MKFLIVLSAFVFNLSAFACSCSGFPLSADGPVQEYVRINYQHGFKISEENMQWLVYYPTLMERLAVREFRGTSCEGAGPNNEPMFHCAGSRKSDFLIVLKDCELLLRVKATDKKVHIKELNSTCRRG